MNKAVWAVLILLITFFIEPADSHAADTSKNAQKKKAATHRKAVAVKKRPEAAVSKQKPRRQVDTQPRLAGKRASRAEKKALPARTAATRRSQERLVKKVITVRGKRKVVYERMKVAAPAAVAGLAATPLDAFNPATDSLNLNSNVVYAIDGTSSEVLFEKNAAQAMPIASITKLMTALVVLDARQDMNEILEVTNDDVDRERFSSSRLPVGARLSRADLLHIALMSSENRAASALGRNFPGGLPAFVAAMNAKAKSLGMSSTVYVEPTGLSSQNVSSARDLAKLVAAATRHPVLARYSVNEEYSVDIGKRMLHYVNSNRLVRDSDWQIELQKTGYISEAGRCLVMQVKMASRSVVMVILNSRGSYERFSEANRLLKWVSHKFQRPIDVKMVSSPN